MNHKSHVTIKIKLNITQLILFTHAQYHINLNMTNNIPNLPLLIIVV